MKFDRNKFTGMDGATTVAFVTENGQVEIHATRASISGTFKIESEAELQVLARIVSDAWVEHRRLQPKLTSTASGH